MFQKLTLVGTLGRDPDMRYLPDGTTVTNFSLAVNRRWTDRQSSAPVEETTWFRVSVWGRPAETANQYLSKGRQVLVEGTLVPDPATGSPRLWTRSDGTIGSSFEVRASEDDLEAARTYLVNFAGDLTARAPGREQNRHGK